MKKSRANVIRRNNEIKNDLQTKKDVPSNRDDIEISTCDMEYNKEKSGIMWCHLNDAIYSKLRH